MVGDVALDAPDLAGELSVLRRTAIQLDSAGLRSKLVIPNEQIRYLMLPAPQKGADVAAHVARALDGATPYAVADLRYDWIAVGDDLHVAAVARETLDEAEGFAEEHDFCPVSFVAIPPGDTFPGEPFFGQTNAAAKLIAPGDRLMRDTHAIRIIGRAETPVTDDPALAAPAALAEDTAAPDVLAEDPAAPVSPQTTDDAAPADLPADSPATPDSDLPPQDTAAALASEPEEGAAASADTDPEAALSEPEPDTAPPPAFSTRRTRAEAPAPTPDPTDTASADPDATPARSAFQVDLPAAAPEPVTAPKTTAPASPAAPPVPAPTAFRSAPPPEDSGTGNGLTQLLARLGGKADTAADTLPPRPVQPRATTPDLSEKQKLTIFGARRPEGAPAQVRGKPRHMGLILTGILLVVLAAAAAWSSLFTDTAPRDTAIAPPADTTPDTPLARDDTPPPAAPVDLARLDDSDTRAALQDAPPALDPASTDLTPPPADPAQSPEQIVDAALSSYAATGIWQIAPDQPGVPPSGTLDDLYLASIDTRLQNFDAVALPDGRAPTDQRPAAQSSPAAPGTTFDLDARGLVTATPEGAETPEGVIVYTGRPAVIPPGIPTRFERTPDPAADPAPGTDPAALRPRLRPDTLVESNERAQLGGLSRNELAEVRPRLRPATLAAVALALQTPAPAPEDEAAEDEADALDGATEQAIASSLKPLARPRDFSSTVESTREAQQTAPQQVAAAAVLAPQRNAAPQIPSSASVAQQATVRGAINLRQVNLIGVYGQPSNRRALVRLSNGRYQKVQVGDRLDGGQVRAIGENELSYVKGNRSIVLTMPRG